MRRLNVYSDRRLVGSLLENDDLWEFQYDPQWMAAADGFDLAPGLPRSMGTVTDGGTTRPVQWFFDNLLPEEGLRLAVSREAGIKGEDAFALLAWLGAESAGSLTLLAPGIELPTDLGVRPLPDAELSARIADLPVHTLASTSPKRMSLAGAQHKLLVVERNGALFEPLGATPSTHILKPSHPLVETYPASVVNEFVTMQLAAAAKLPVPRVSIRYVPDPVYLVERFDRQVTGSGRGEGGGAIDVGRLHIIDACQLLNKSRQFKHSGASLQALRQLIDAATNRLQTRTALFRWLVFNVLVGNDDCHLKNLSFFVRPNEIRLAPHYDLLATSAYYTKAYANDRATWDGVSMAIPLPSAERFGDVTRQSLLDAGGELGLPAAVRQRILEATVKGVLGAVPKLIPDAEARHEKQQVPPNQRAAEIRFLRVLESIIVGDMAKRLL